MERSAYFITFEGTDGVGKSTQARKLRSWLIKQGKNVVLTREPGGGRVAEKIREILLDPRTKIDPLTELFLYESARADHMEKVVRPALKRGRWVICDRFTDATLAYQGYARGLSYNVIERLNRVATGGIKPDITILLDLPAHEGLKKAASRGKKDRLEKEGSKFLEKVRRGYLALAKKHRKRIAHVQVRHSIEATQVEIQALIKKFL